MKNDLIHQNRTKIFWIIVSVVGIYLLYGCAVGGTRLVAYNNGKEIEETLSKLTYAEKNCVEEINKLEPFVDKRYLPAEQLGKLYKALAELSYMTGDDMLYNKYVATALFHLETAGDTDSVVYLTNKYMGRLYANGCYEAAENLLVDLSTKYKISELPLGIQASYYLSRADLAQMLGSSEGDYLKEAKAAIQLMDDCSEKELNRGKLSILTARCNILNNQWKKAQDILSRYTEEESFGYKPDQVYVICDFQIPYNELMAKMYLHDHKIKTAEKYMKKYFALCEKFQFRAMELNLLIYANRQPVMKNSGIADSYDEMEKSLLQRNLSEITNEYAQILLTDMDNTKHNLSLGLKEEKQHRRYVLIGIVCLSIVITAGFMMSILIDYLQCDTLTKLNNRKKYEKVRSVCDKKKIPYGFLMIDIDDFKQVNDTLGHHQGDVVLSGIASVLLSYTGRGIFAFRYGGEEMCLMLLRVPQKRTYEIAEEIRQKIEQTQFVPDRKITISGGISMSEHGENVFVHADQKLYQAKANGKNQICM